MKITEASVVEAIRIVFTRGAGTDIDPVRRVVQWREPTGELIAELDPFDARERRKAPSPKDLYEDGARHAREAIASWFEGKAKTCLDPEKSREWSACAALAREVAL